MSKKVIVVIGPTGVGKTKLGVQLAHWLNTEVISGDSIQVYRGLDIGSAKVTQEETEGVKHHLIDIKDATDSYSVAEFQSKAREIMDSLDAQGKMPLIVGGTGLYVKAVLYDYVFEQEEGNHEAELAALESWSNEQLWEELLRIDPNATRNLHPNNRQRVKRAIVMAQSGTKKSERDEAQEHKMIYDAFVIGCTMDREKLYERINLRVNLMMKDGLMEEMERLVKDVPDFFEQQCAVGIGYREWKEYFLGNISKEMVIEDIQKHSRQFAKRQYTWFRNQMPVHWYDMSSTSFEDIQKDIQTWLEGND